VGLDDLNVHDCGGYGLNSDNPGDARIALSDSKVETTQDTGVAFRGSNVTVARNTIADTGINAAGAITIPLHGIYAKGPAPTIVGNRIVDFQAAAVTIRSTGSLVADNVISAPARGQRGIAYYQQTAVPGTTTIRGNLISGVRVQGIAIDNGSTTADFGGGATTASTSESFVISHNTIVMRGDVAVYAVEGIRLLQVPSVTLTGNQVGGLFTYALNAHPPLGPFLERGNAWRAKRSARSFLWSGAKVTFGRYRAASGQGLGDRLF
jgi:hypothetical protein